MYCPRWSELRLKSAEPVSSAANGYEVTSYSLISPFGTLTMARHFAYRISTASAFVYAPSAALCERFASKLKIIALTLSPSSQVQRDLNEPRTYTYSTWVSKITDCNIEIRRFILYYHWITYSHIIAIQPQVSYRNQLSVSFSMAPSDLPDIQRSRLTFVSNVPSTCSPRPLQLHLHL